MLDRRIWGLLLTVAAAGLLPSACGGDEITKVVTVGPEAGTGEQGETCAQPTDCGADLLCVNGICVANSGDALGQQGESCQSRDDCASDLSCINNVCTDPTTVDGGAQMGSGKRGESCQTRSDCEAGLICVNGTCTIEEFALDQAANRCKYVDCNSPTDCLQLDPETCDTYAESCAAALTPGESVYCDYVRIYCMAANWTCTAEGECDYTGTCAEYYSTDCPDSLDTCDLVEDTCVQCNDSSPCVGANQECVDGVCVAGCESNQDCPLLWACDDTKTCVEQGCATDRECVAYTGNALAVCVNTECSTPCQTDSECASVNGYNFKACIDNFCQDVGCETAEECRIRGNNIGIAVCAPP